MDLSFITDNFAYIWPGLAVACVLSVIGQFLSLRVFTKDRAYAFYGKDRLGKFCKWCMWWGREALPIFHVGSGLAIGRYYWVDPVGQGWGPVASAGYFASAGFVSMFVWAVLKGRAKKYGIVLELPGETIPPIPYVPEGVDDEAAARSDPSEGGSDPRVGP